MAERNRRELIASFAKGDNEFCDSAALPRHGWQGRGARFRGTAAIERLTTCDGTHSQQRRQNA